MEKLFLHVAAILIACLGFYVFIRSQFVAEKIKTFYSDYPLVRYAGEKQLTIRAGLVKVVGAVLIFIGVFCLFYV